MSFCIYHLDIWTWQLSQLNHCVADIQHDTVILQLHRTYSGVYALGIKPLLDREAVKAGKAWEGRPAGLPCIARFGRCPMSTPSLICWLSERLTGVSSVACCHADLLNRIGSSSVEPHPVSFETTGSTRQHAVCFCNEQQQLQSVLLQSAWSVTLSPAIHSTTQQGTAA